MRILVAALCLAGCKPTAPTTVPVPVTAASVSLVTAPIVRAELSPPFTLTASDGSGLALVRVDAKAVMEGPLAFTELHLIFDNTEDRMREGTFQITLPPRAAISRFAMEHAGAWMEAEVVPKLYARRAYEDFLHRKQDPALLEKAAGNQFTARVFPIAARSRKHLVISYSQELPGQRYVLPLRGLPRAEAIDVQLGTHRLSERDWQPDRDFVAPAPAVAAVGAGTLVAAQVEVTGKTAREAPRGITLLLDTSASRALGFAGYVAKTKRLVDDLRATWNVPLQVIAFDQDTQVILDGGDFRDEHVRALLARGAAGASDLGQALAFVARRGAHPRVVIVGDGVITAGAEGKELQAIVKQLNADRVDVVLAGGLRDERAAQTIVRALPRAGAVLDIDDAAAALGDAVATDIAIDVPGATWVSPRSIASARAGEKVMVFAKLAQPAKTIEIVAGGTRRSLRIVDAAAPLVERALAGAEIEELERTGAPREEIAKRSVAARVLSSETSMLVLESEADYPRYKIDRTALADVLVVGDRGVQRIKRSDITPIPTVTPSQPRVHEIAELRPATTVATTKDNDADGILDAVDRCPGEPEAFNGQQDDDGCPDRGRVVVAETHIVVLQAVNFAHRSALIRKESLPLLDAVREVLANNRDIELIEIGGHTDERGDDAANLALSDARAEAVRRYLVERGIDPKRVEARGYGETQPIDARHNEAAWAKNRRVEFLILKRRFDEAPAVTRTWTKPQPPPPPPPPVTGELAEIQAALAKRDVDGALERARDWHAREPGNVLALVGLGEALEARNAVRPPHACTDRSSICSRGAPTCGDSPASGSRASRTRTRSPSIRFVARSRIARITSRGIACSPTRSCARIARPTRSPRSCTGSVRRIAPAASPAACACCATTRA
jgi:outer membrane protein OmpA-like peptidoglycan-associated protein